MMLTREALNVILFLLFINAFSTVLCKYGYFFFFETRTHTHLKEILFYTNVFETWYLSLCSLNLSNAHLFVSNMHTANTTWIHMPNFADMICLGFHSKFLMLL